MLQTGAFVPIHALSQKKHPYSRLMFSLLIPLVYVSKPGWGRASRKCILRQHLGECNQRRTVELVNQYGSKDLVRVALGTRNDSLGQRFRQK